MATKKSETIEKTVFDIKSLFSRENEENGVWFRPAPKGQYVPFQLKVIGPTSSKAWVVTDQYNKDLDAARAISDLKERADAVIVATAKRYAGYCIDLKIDDGVEIPINGHQANKNDIYDIMFNSPEVQDEVYTFYNESESFLGVKKND